MSSFPNPAGKLLFSLLSSHHSNTHDFFNIYSIFLADPLNSLILKTQQLLYQETRSSHSNIQFPVKLLGPSESVFTKLTLHTEFLNNHITLAAGARTGLMSSLSTHLKGNKNKTLSLEPQQAG